MKQLRVTCFIDNLGSGGAQRQLCTLAIMLKKRGVDVSMLTYHQSDFFLPLLKQEGIEIQTIEHASKIKRILAVRRLLREGCQDVVLAFLPGPCLYAELAALPMRKWGLVVSERQAVPGSHRDKFPWDRYLHCVADYVTTNSHTNRLMIEQAVPSLAGRVVTIYNTFDLDTFRPCRPANEVTGPVTIVVAASHQWHKNLSALIAAMAIVHAEQPDLAVEVHWYGDIPPDPAPYDEGVRQIEQHGLADHVKLFPASRSIAAAYNSADAVALFSHYEGLPNVVCEGMACGRPILMSNVCDAQNLVLDGENGFLFDPSSPTDIARKIMTFCALPQAVRETMGTKSRERAEYMFDQEQFADSYLQVLEAAASRYRITPRHWIPDVPNSARDALKEITT